MAKTDPRKTEHWRQHIEAYRNSELTRKAYCRKHRLNIHQLDYWRKRLNRSSEIKPSINKNDFVQIQVEKETLPGSCINLHIGQVSVEVPDGFDPVHLKNILQALGIAC